MELLCVKFLKYLCNFWFYHFLSLSPSIAPLFLSFLFFKKQAFEK